ncbi:hypothetical protein EYF80_025191 [Liparis tanakae]|uniref:Uncharacterized protein n=1 Tax=Liparis tanakae TaxID=230148 RepID=A0A4Z2HI28_9TELE|nr:hypothetical protein EYF80_025191 [Liparis tanakae]
MTWTTYSGQLTAWAMVMARCVASASTSSGRHSAWPSGPVMPRDSIFLAPYESQRDGDNVEVPVLGVHLGDGSGLLAVREGGVQLRVLQHEHVLVGHKHLKGIDSLLFVVHRLGAHELQLHVCVRVDAARNHELVSGIDDSHPVRDLEVQSDIHDLPMFDVDVADRGAFLVHNFSPLDQDPAGLRHPAESSRVWMRRRARGGTAERARGLSLNSNPAELMQQAGEDEAFGLQRVSRGPQH